jgi:hypothetical protein
VIVSKYPSGILSSIDISRKATYGYGTKGSQEGGTVCLHSSSPLFEPLSSFVFLRFLVLCVFIIFSGVFPVDQRIEVLGDGGMLTAENRPTTTVILSDERGHAKDVNCYSFPQRYVEAYALELNHFMVGSVCVCVCVCVLDGLACREVSSLSLSLSRTCISCVVDSSSFSHLDSRMCVFFLILPA